MPTPTSPISFGDIYSEANGGTPGGPTDWGRLARDSYFEGPNGNSSIGFNAWGSYGSSLGANRMFQIPIDSSPNFDSYRNKTYFYGQTPTPFDVSLYASNANADDVDNVDVQCYDDNLIYSYMGGNTGLLLSGNTYGPNTFQNLQPGITPLIQVLYWQLIISTSPVFAGGTVDYYINGNLVLAGGVVNPGPAPNIYDYTMGSTEGTRLNLGYTGSYHEVYIT